MCPKENLQVRTGICVQECAETQSVETETWNRPKRPTEGWTGTSQWKTAPGKLYVWTHLRGRMLRGENVQVTKEYLSGIILR